jgi:hypothetical protein
MTELTFPLLPRSIGSVKSKVDRTFLQSPAEEDDSRALEALHEKKQTCQLSLRQKVGTLPSLDGSGSYDEDGWMDVGSCHIRFLVQIEPSYSEDCQLTSFSFDSTSSLLPPHESLSKTLLTTSLQTRSGHMK